MRAFFLIDKNNRILHTDLMPVYIPGEGEELVDLNATEAITHAASQLQPGDLGAAFAKMFVTLAALCILLFATYWFLRKFIQNRLQKGVDNSSIRILEKRMISPKTTLYLIEADHKKVLLAESHLEIKALLKDPEIQ